MNGKPKARPTYPFKIKPFTEKELMKMEKKTKPKARPTMLTPGRVKSGVGPRKKLRGNDAIREYEKQISPSGMAKTKRQQDEALRKLQLERSKKRIKK